MQRILVTGVGGGVGQGVIKALKRIDDLPLTIVAADMSPLAAWLYTADEAILVPAAKSPTYVDELVALCVAHRIDVYVPGTDIELAVAAEHASAIEARCGTTVLVCPPEVVEIADDKMRTAQTLRDAGFPYPETWEPSEVDPDTALYPLIVKPRRGFRSIGVARVTDAASLRAALADRTDDPIVQECVATADDEYTCTVAVIDGEASPVLPLRRVLRGGDTYRATPVQHAEIERVVRDVALAIGVRGSCNFQLRLDGDTPKIFEINARFSVTTPFCAQLGFNPVEWCLKRLAGVPYAPEIRWDVTLLRHWAEVVVPHAQIDALGASGAIVTSGITTTDLGDR